MHGRKASNPVMRLRIEETSVIKNLKTDNFKNSRPSSRGMMEGTNNRINNSNAKLQQPKESPAGLRLRLGANIEKLRSPSRLRVDSTPRFKNKKLSSPFGSPSGRSTPPSPLANSARKMFLNNNSTSSLSGVGDNGGSSPDSNRGRSPSPLSLSMQNTNSYKNNNTTPRSRNTSIGTESLKSGENKLLHANNNSIASTPRSSTLSNKNSPAQHSINSVSPSLSTRTNRSSGSSNFNNNDSMSPSSMHQFQNINFDISKNNNNHSSEDDFNPVNNHKYRSSKTSLRKQVNFHKPIDSNDNKKSLSKGNKVAIAVTSTKSMKVDNDIRPFHGYNINLKHLRKDLENKGHFNDNGDINILSRYVRNESYNLTETVSKFVNNIDSFQKYVDQNCMYLAQMAKKVDNNKLNLIGQRMQQIDKEEKNKRKKQDLVNDIELLSMRSERLDIEYASLLRALEKQQALLKRLSSD
eukprot:g1938.t1